MDKVAQVASMANFEAVKEPRGFIKIIEFILSIFAFATTTAHVADAYFTVQCEGDSANAIHLHCSYPFNLQGHQFNKIHCSNDTATTVAPLMSMYGNYSGSSQFYVFVGVMAFLYSLAMLLLYVFADDKYHNIEAIPMVDFVVTIVFVLLWLISSSAWADGVTHVKRYMDPTEYYGDMPACSGLYPPTNCKDANYGNFASLNVSIIFGFLNMCVWGGNLWFLYKETKWFKPPPPGDTPSQSPPQAGTPQQI